MKKDTKIYLILGAIVLLIILGIKFYPSSEISKEGLVCIAENSQLFTLSTCSHCFDQKKLIQDRLDKYNLKIDEVFNIITCDLSDENNKLCIEKNIQSVPLWIIEDQKYLGVQSLEKLKQLTDC